MEEQNYGAYIEKADGTKEEFKVHHDDEDFAKKMKEWIFRRRGQQDGTNDKEKNEEGRTLQLILHQIAGQS